MIDRVKIAGFQMEPQIMKPEENLEKVINGVRTAAASYAELIVFPECALSGYCYSTREEAAPFAETVPGPSTDKLASLCKELNIYVIVGLLEKASDKLFNSAAFIGPDGLIGCYRKHHLPKVGLDSFVNYPNDPFEVYQTPIGNIGVQICYDTMFPEGPRIMALLGADILAIPTNYSPLPWGRGEKITKYVTGTRAMENRVHVVAVDRIGTERGFIFVGRSQIINALGDILAEANHFKEEIIYGEVSLAMARQKHGSFIPGVFEVNGIDDRRPELYGQILKPRQILAEV